MPQEGLLKGIPTFIVPSTAVGAGVNGAAFALPSSRAGRPVTWRTAFQTPPGAVSMRLQGSLSANTPVWFDIDSSTNVNGEIKTVSGDVFPSVQVVRGRMESVTGGDNFAVEITI